MPDFGRMIDEFIYSVIVMIAGVHWSLQKAIIMAGYTLKLIHQWPIENAFVPIIAQTNDSLRLAVSYVFIIALLVLGLTYMLAALVRLLDSETPQVLIEARIIEANSDFEREVGASTAEEARSLASEVAHRLLANPVIESYRIEVAEPV